MNVPYVVTPMTLRKSAITTAERDQEQHPQRRLVGSGRR